MAARFARSTGSEFAQGVAILAFAVVFLVVGIFRVVEFQDKGFGALKRRTLVTIHLLGTVIACLAMALFALDINATHTHEIGFLVGAAFILLLPTHIYLALIRRIKLKARQS